MSRFENKLCPVCRERFRDGDDIAVCPECGTPHHRACYLKQNKCALEGLHAQGYVWNGRLPDEPLPTVPRSVAEAYSAASAVPEPLERKMSNLGDDPENSDADSADKKDESENKNTEDKTFELLGLPDPDDDIYGAMGMDSSISELYKIVTDRTRGADGVSMRELIAYTGTSIWHYSRVFRAFRGAEDGKKHLTSFNLCSGLFSPIFQFYRKMDWLGVLLLVISVLPTFIVITLSDSAAAAQNMLVELDMLFKLINVAECVLLCLFGDYLFYKQAVRRILKTRRNFEGDTGSVEYLQALSECGRPSFARAVLGCLGLMFANALVIAISGGMFG